MFSGIRKYMDNPEQFNQKIIGPTNYTIRTIFTFRPICSLFHDKLFDGCLKLTLV